MTCQAKALLAELRAGNTTAAKTFVKHLPKARGFSIAQVRAAAFRLADAQSVVARRSGFPSWPVLVRHVELLRALGGEWAFEALHIDGKSMPHAMISESRLLLDGDLFRMTSAEANYDGRFVIVTAATPMQIDIEFVEGPEAGNYSYGIFEQRGDQLTICLGLVGAPRPTAFESRAGSGHALEHLRRTSALRPEGITGGVVTPGKKAEEASLDGGLVAEFSALGGALYQRLEGAWTPVRLVTNDEEMRADWLAFGSRVGEGNEVTVVFGGQVMLHVKMRIDDTVLPVAVDYLHLLGSATGKVSYGILEWVGDEVRFLIAAPGQARPLNFAEPGSAYTMSHWRRGK